MKEWASFYYVSFEDNEITISTEMGCTYTVTGDTDEFYRIVDELRANERDLAAILGVDIMDIPEAMIIVELRRCYMLKIFVAPKIAYI